MYRARARRQEGGSRGGQGREGQVTFADAAAKPASLGHDGEGDGDDKKHPGQAPSGGSKARALRLRQGPTGLAWPQACLASFAGKPTLAKALAAMRCTAMRAGLLGRFTCWPARPAPASRRPIRPHLSALATLVGLPHSGTPTSSAYARHATPLKPGLATPGSVASYKKVATWPALSASSPSHPLFEHHSIYSDSPT
ncbi:uncharacterized protein PSFLO_02053 [Pseudozyma flocculosa]|uniref:Uncharacterized protein n=1 Tax=Pseudozyma flocculosa TaxID=84751 RepID=A0A5C3EWZ2_9BASI|nr:uncharacterized protein PSFLO_02053 [Pseudozyma flocculosa]